MFNNIRAEMARHGMSVQDVADLLGITAVSVYLKLNGKTPFMLDEVFKLAVKFNVSLDYLAIKTDKPDVPAA